MEKFEAADKELKEFLSDPDVHEVMKQLESLVDTRNQALGEASRAVKNELTLSDGKRLAIGEIGAQKKWRRWYDGEFLAHALPAKQSDLVLTEVVTYEVDEEKLDQLLRQGEIDNEIVQAAYHEEEQAPSAMPGTPKEYTLPRLPVVHE